MSKKNYYKNKYIYIGIFSIVIILLLMFVLINTFVDKNKISTNIPEPLPEEVVELIRLQQTQWIREILNVDCEWINNNEAKQYCIKQKKLVNKIWESQ